MLWRNVEHIRSYPLEMCAIATSWNIMDTTENHQYKCLLGWWPSLLGWRPSAIASRLEAIASRVEAIASRLEAISSRLEAIAIRLEALPVGWRPWLVGWRPSLIWWRPLQVLWLLATNIPQCLLHSRFAWAVRWSICCSETLNVEHTHWNNL